MTNSPLVYSTETGKICPSCQKPVSETYNFDPELSEACKTCIENCPATALVMGNENIPVVNLDLCIGWGVCATGCPEEAIDLVERDDILIPPVDQRALAEAVNKADQAG